MKLLIDIGNTNTSMAVIEGQKILKRYFIYTSKEKVAPRALKCLLGVNLKKIDRVIIVSVVPKFLSILKKSFKSIVPSTPISVIGRNIKVPIKNTYNRLRDVGQDRLVIAYAASRQAGTPVLTIDFGTAVTLDLVNKKGEYEGGLIFPGLRLGLGSLVKNTALLPKVELKSTKGLIGKTTRGSINKGILYGYAAMCDGLVGKFRQKYGSSLKVVATGGDAGLIAKHSRHITKVCPDLIFTGLRLLVKKS